MSFGRLARRPGGRLTVTVGAAHVKTFLSVGVELKKIGGVLEDVALSGEGIQFPQGKSVRALVELLKSSAA